MASFSLRLSVISISFLTVMAPAAIAPALAKISQAFPTADPALITLVLTLPSLLIAPVSLLCGWLTRRMRKKPILLTGLAIYLLAGVSGAFSRTIYELLCIRMLLGIGAGLIVPFSTELIADSSEEERRKLTGLSGPISYLGGAAFLLLSGWLACISWRHAFAVYGLSALTFFTVFFLLPEPTHKEVGHTQKNGLPAGVYMCTLLGGLLMVVSYAAPINLAMFIESESRMYTNQTPLLATQEELRRFLTEGIVSASIQDSFLKSGIQLSGKAVLTIEGTSKQWTILDGDKKYSARKENGREGLVIYTERQDRPRIAGYCLSLMLLAGVFSGFALTISRRRFGALTPATGIGSMAAGYALLGGTSSLSGVLIAMVCLGFGSGILLPLLLLRATEMVTGHSRALAMAVLNAGVYFGQFLSPVILKWLGLCQAAGGIYRQQFIGLALALGIAALLGIPRRPCCATS
ncbi:MAG TPA: MFS transporter [Patescibacteria group bacterium]|nr:MFS transporter [Patescibacteria group bacterium]